MSTIPERVREVYEELKQQVMKLHAVWVLYCQLFRSKRRVGLLNECAPAFFYTIQHVILDEVQMSLSKLMDPSRTGEHENLSLKQLQKRLDAECEPELTEALQRILERLKARCKPIRDRRHTRGAHWHLDTALRRSNVEALPSVSIQMIEDGLRLIREYMGLLEDHYSSSLTPTLYEHVVMDGDANALVDTLKRGLRYDDLRGETIPYDDLAHGEWKDA